MTVHRMQDRLFEIDGRFTNSSAQWLYKYSFMIFSEGCKRGRPARGENAPAVWPVRRHVVAKTVLTQSRIADTSFTRRNASHALIGRPH